jgi:hypothetical protein
VGHTADGEVGPERPGTSHRLRTNRRGIDGDSGMPRLTLVVLLVELGELFS